MLFSTIKKKKAKQKTTTNLYSSTITFLWTREAEGGNKGT